ncbi:hypothetical protein HNY73_011735, partial [Argiope bruennichi]
LAKGGGESSSEGASNRNNKNATPRAERGRGRGRGKGQIIQLEGALFGEGIAPSAVKGLYHLLAYIETVPWLIVLSMSDV